MKQAASLLRQITEEYLPSLHRIGEKDWVNKPAPDKWSKKEILGHLVDSAQNNIRRFINAQYEEKPSIRYNQDQWVAINHYQDWEPGDIITLWYLLNKQLCHIMNHTPESLYDRSCQTEAPHTIQWLAADYIKHLQHHLHAVLNLEPVAYP